MNGNGEMKPGKSGITLEFEELVKLIPKAQDSIARYELKDTGVSTTPMELDIPVLDLDKLEFICEVASVESMKKVERKFLADTLLHAAGKVNGGHQREMYWLLNV